MATSFAENLRLVLKRLSMSPAALASALEIDKSVVSRWLSGSVEPSSHNLARLSALVAKRVEGFSALDWDREPRSLASFLGTDPDAISTMRGSNGGLTLPIWPQMVATATVRGQAYEGFFRSTRPHPRNSGRFLHEFGMIRRDSTGLLRLSMGSAESVVEGWMIPLHDLLYCVAADVKSGALLFGIFNGSGASRLDVFDGLVLIPGADMGRSPTATAMICERLGVLCGDREADDRRFVELSSQNPLAPEGSVPEHIVKHLLKDFGPAQLAQGGDLLLHMSLMRSLTRGPDYEAMASPRTLVNSDGD